MFENREDAGRKLAQLIKKLDLDPEDTVILAIPRGGVPVAFEVSRETKIPFSLVVVKKLTLPHAPESAVGAIAPDGTYVIDKQFFPIVSQGNILEQMISEAMKEIKKRLEKYLNNKIPDVKDKTVIIIDDGLATGYTALVAGLYARNLGAKGLILAVPVCPADSIQKAKKVFQKVICAEVVNDTFFAVGAYYKDFHQLSDEEMLSYLKLAEELGILYNKYKEEENENI
ncbi:MAG: phosphoribosyltransferase [Aquificae bacterium]|nr:phosphoribosyltransferase [Aquificota bacterium]